MQSSFMTFKEKPEQKGYAYVRNQFITVKNLHTYTINIISSIIQLLETRMQYPVRTKRIHKKGRNMRKEL